MGEENKSETTNQEEQDASIESAEAKTLAEAEKKEGILPEAEKVKETETHEGEETVPIAKYKELEHKLSSTQGSLKQALKDKGDLQKSFDVSDIRTQLQTLGETLNLVVDVLATGAEDSQEKIQKHKETVLVQQKSRQEANSTLEQIKSMADIVGVDMTHEVLIPAKQAYEKGDLKGSLNLTMIALKGLKTSTAKIATPEIETTKTEVKEKLKSKMKVLVTAGASKSTEGMTAKEKINIGLQEARQRQG